MTSDEYNIVLPSKEKLKLCFETGDCRADHQLLTIASAIRQRYGYRPVDFNCSGCKVEAIKDLYSYLLNYESTLNTNC